ncbi:MAG: hypothetical protein ACOY71_12095 [Gemmatimonadota bacterium]
MTSHISLQDLRRVAESLASLKGKSVVSAAMRSDLRQLRIELSDGLIMVVSADADADGRAHLELDVVRQPDEHARQLEVRFETA